MNSDICFFIFLQIVNSEILYCRVICREIIVRVKNYRFFFLVGFKDFIPEHNRRNQENKGYEVFYDMMQRATQWVARQQGVRFISIQTLDVKIKKSK